MKYILLVRERNGWIYLQAQFGGDDTLRETAEKLDQNLDWMIVQLVRYHGGVETETIES